MFATLSRAGRWVLLVALVAISHMAWAHAVLVASTPRADETVAAGQLSIDLKFNSRVDGPHSIITLVAPGGGEKRLPVPTQLAPNEVRTEAGELTAGSYSIRWQALSSDGHITRGQIDFKVQ